MSCKWGPRSQWSPPHLSTALCSLYTWCFLTGRPHFRKEKLSLVNKSSCSIWSNIVESLICLFLDSTVKKKQSVLCFYLSRWPEWRWLSCRFRPILNRLVLLQPFHRAYMEQCMDEKNCRDIKTKLTRDTSKYHCKLANNYPSPLSPSDEWFTILAVVNSKKVWMLKTTEKKITRTT